jgi:hypothetical protein
VDLAAFNATSLITINSLTSTISYFFIFSADFQPLPLLPNLIVVQGTFLHEPR